MNRSELDKILREVLGSSNVYFQPPESLKIQYPAIVYSRDSIPKRFADDMVYSYNTSYTVTVIDKNPDSPIVTRVTLLPMCRFDRHFVSDNLNHDVFTLYW